jgi:hypothetical protein
MASRLGIDTQASEDEKLLQDFSALLKKPKAETPASPAAPEKKAEETGVMASLGRAAAAVPARAKEGVGQMAEAGAPKWQEKEALPGGGTMTTTREPAGIERVGQSAMGLANTLFPFAAGAGSLAGDFNDWINSGITPEQADAELKSQIEALTKLNVPGAPTDFGPQIKMLSDLLATPHETRAKNRREAASLAGELGSGLISGYTGAARAIGKGATAAAGKMTARQAKLAAAEAELGAAAQVQAKAAQARAERQALNQASYDKTANAKPVARNVAGDPVASAKAVVEQSGAKWNGVQEDAKGRPAFAMFTDDVTKSTVMIPINEVTPETVAAKLAAKQAEFEAARPAVKGVDHAYVKDVLDDVARAHADEYDAAVTDPAAKPAWDALAKSTDELYDDIVKRIKAEPVTGEPYANADEMIADMKKGSFKVSTDNSDHPFWTPEQNWKFRVVHDVLGHLDEGNDFSLKGEEKAFRAHVKKVTDDAAKAALQTEVYGQAASAVKNARFSEQKAFLPKDRLDIPTSGEELVRTANEQGGFTFDPRIGRMDTGKTGYAVSNTKGGSMNTPLAEFTPAQIEEFATTHADELGEPDAFHGAWVWEDEAGVKHVSQDVTRIIEDQAQANEIGAATTPPQKAIWDRANSAEIPVTRKLFRHGAPSGPMSNFGESEGMVAPFSGAGPLHSLEMSAFEAEKYRKSNILADPNADPAVKAEIERQGGMPDKEFLLPEDQARGAAEHYPPEPRPIEPAAEELQPVVAPPMAAADELVPGAPLPEVQTVADLHAIAVPTVAKAKAEVAQTVATHAQAHEAAKALAQQMRAAGASRAEIHEAYKAKLNEMGVESKAQAAEKAAKLAAEPDPGVGGTVFPDDEFHKALDNLRERLDEVMRQLNNEVGAIRLRGDITAVLKKNSETWNDLKAVGAGVLHYGAREFEDWAKVMVETLGEAVVPHLKALHPEAVKQLKAFNQTRYERDLPSIAAIRDAGKRGEPGFEWYDDAPAELARRFGPNADTWAGTYAATSPLQDAATTNIDLAHRSYNQIISGERDGVRRKFSAKRDGIMPVVADNLNRVARGELVSGPKIGPFEGVLRQDAFESGARDIPVIDTWMYRFFGLLPESPEDVVSKTTEAHRRFIETVLTKIAQEEGADVVQVQAAIWTRVKTEVEAGRLARQAQDEGGNWKPGWTAERFSEALDKLNSTGRTPLHGLLQNRLGPAAEAARLQTDTDGLIVRKATMAMVEHPMEPEIMATIELQKLGMQSDAAAKVATGIMDEYHVRGLAECD